jgi:hypothetical protein
MPIVEKLRCFGVYRRQRDSFTVLWEGGNQMIMEGEVKKVENFDFVISGLMPNFASRAEKFKLFLKIVLFPLWAP